MGLSKEELVQKLIAAEGNVEGARSQAKNGTGVDSGKVSTDQKMSNNWLTDNNFRCCKVPGWSLTPEAADYGYCDDGSEHLYYLRDNGALLGVCCDPEPNKYVGEAAKSVANAGIWFSNGLQNLGKMGKNSYHRLEDAARSIGANHSEGDRRPKSKVDERNWATGGYMPERCGEDKWATGDP